MAVGIKYRIGKRNVFQGIRVLLFLVCIMPLISILIYIIKAGITKINWHFLPNIPKTEGETRGGFVNALQGSKNSRRNRPAFIYSIWQSLFIYKYSKAHAEPAFAYL